MAFSIHEERGNLSLLDEWLYLLFFTPPYNTHHTPLSYVARTLYGDEVTLAGADIAYKRITGFLQPTSPRGMTQSVRANSRLVTPSKYSVWIPRLYVVEDRDRNEGR